MKAGYKLWLDENGKAFGQGPYQLLENIERCGSLNEAAAKMDMSYSRAWKLINTIEKRLGFRLLRRETGGVQGGGSFLTEEAKELMKRYDAFSKEAEDTINKLYLKHFET